MITEDVDIYNITDFGAYIRGLKYTTFEAILPDTDSINTTELISKTRFDKLTLRNDLETEIDALNEIKELFLTGDINYTKIYTLKKSALISEYTRFDLLELVQGEFTKEHLEAFVSNVIKSVDDVKQMILENLVKV